MKNNAKLVGIGVISTLLVVFLVQPLLLWLWEISLNLLHAVYAQWEDSLYRNAAYGHRDHAANLLLSLACGAIIGLAFGSLMQLIRLRRSNTPSILRQYVLAGCVGVMLGIAVVLVNVNIRAFTDQRLNMSFAQRITILAPVVSDQTAKELRADWASMTSKWDYDVLNAKMDRIAKENDITLPSPLI